MSSKNAKTKRKIDYYSWHPFEAGVLYQLPNLDILCEDAKSGSFHFKYFLKGEIMPAGSFQVESGARSMSKIIPVPETNGVLVSVHAHEFQVSFAGPKVQ